ncbi:MAG: N-acetyl-gamma-glutamyl-phosphate reductase [Chloroflexi bacterium]|nr:N-acetyl-gamma-glutamyl-phosphate reductase [Chloroflexota bacterium]
MAIKVAIAGATGYAGGELARLLLRHPEAKLVAAVGRSSQGKALRDALPHLLDAPASLTVGADVGDAEVVFTTLPAGEAAKQASAWLAEGRKVVDVGSDFRLKDPKDYETWYGFTHPAPDLLRESAYGLTEFHRAEIKKARVVANPGCYPNASLLALAPAVRAGLVSDDFIIDAKSGVSGAGHTVDEAYLFGSIDSSVRPYGAPKHRHTPEIKQDLALMAGKPVRLTFTPHLIPMTRGLVATCYVSLRDGATAAQVKEAYAGAYTEEPFVRVTSRFPGTKEVFGSNWCLVYATVDEANRRLIAVGALDNLVKGAAGSALQNFNVMYGFPEAMGLGALPIWP